MSLDDEITNYLEQRPNKSTAEKINFLIKLWNSAMLKSSEKYETITKFFIGNLTSDLSGGIEEVASEVRAFLKLKPPPNSVSSETRKKLLESFRKMLEKKSPSDGLKNLCLELVSQETFKDFFKLHLDIYTKFLKSIIKSCSDTSNQEPEILLNIIRELYCFANVDDFKKRFLKDILVQLHRVSSSSNPEVNSAKWDLMKSMFFSQVVLSEASFDIFETQLSEEQQAILMETFIVVNKFRPDQIARLVEFFFDRVLTNSEDAEFLGRSKNIFMLMQAHDIDLAPVKRLNVELFEKFASRVNEAIESSKQSMDFATLLDTLTSFISCDAFLFEKKIYHILMDCMMKEKSGSELESYEKLLDVVVKIYGKDMPQFLKKMLKSINETLDHFTIPKKRKRKLLSGGGNAEQTPKKKKLLNSEASEGVCEGNHIASMWPKSMSDHFAEIVASLNVAQSIKVWNQLNEFLADTLANLKESQIINENVLFKIDFASNLLTEFFLNARLHEQLMYKREQIASTVKEFTETENLFYEIILNIEYNSRVLYSFLRISSAYENFLMLFFYNYNSEMTSELESLFIERQSRMTGEWQIIQQRVKNFGKVEETNQLNSLLLQQQQKTQLYNLPSASKLSDIQSILSDDKQVEFLLGNADTRSGFIKSLESKDLKNFAKFLINLENRTTAAAALKIIAQNQDILDNFVTEMSSIEDEQLFEETLKILNQLPLAFVSDENKKLIFGNLLEKKFQAPAEGLVEKVVMKLFENDSYKLIFKMYTMKKIVKLFSDTQKFSRIFRSILVNAARKMNPETLENFNWIVKNDDIDLLFILARTIVEVPLTPVGGVTTEALKLLKADLLSALLKSTSKIDLKNLSTKNCNELRVLSQLVGDNALILKDDIKAEYSGFLQKVVKTILKSLNNERAKFLLLTLKDAKKVNLNDEMKSAIVEALLLYLTSTLLEKLSKADEKLDVELEKEIFASLKPFKSNFQDHCVEKMRQKLSMISEPSSSQLQYGFKVYQIALSNTSKSSGVVKSYLKFHEECVAKAVTFKYTEVLIESLETNNKIISDSKTQLENTSIDEFLCLLINPRIKPETFSIEDFSKFYGAVGETLFVIANIRQNYFKSRISQYFNVYKSLLDAIYFYKNDQPDELKPIETSLLLKLTLQLENIMNMVVSNHQPSIKIVSLYVASSIVSIFVKNPKTLSNGNKFKVNIKNICYQLLSTIDDKTRKHIYSVADETTRDVYDGLFSETRRRS